MTLIKRLSESVTTLAFAMLMMSPLHAQEIRVTLLGTGTPILNINRFGISMLVEAGNQKLLFDAGRGVATRLHQRNVPIRDIDAVFVSLMNSDHVTGLADLYASAPLPTDDGRRTTPLVMYGPEGIENVAAGLKLMLKDNNRLRLLAKETNPGAIDINANVVKPGVVFDRDGVKVSAFLIEHGVTKPDYGYRVEYMGRTVVITDDCTYSENLVANAKGADLMVQSVAIASKALEARDMDYANHFYSYLANPKNVARIFSEAKPKLAVLAHISLYSRHGIPRASMDELRDRISQGYRGRFVIGEDLMSFIIGNDGASPVPYDPGVRSREPI
ncbi:Ribonuclease Z [Pandoraea eparura]|jgi:ribonuclease Z|uniref:Ribonuclease Z n=1 Tax=Pandoraea eparura TaxID=2508291 RepID=A0A5E4ULL9_9BURK|nr:MBL fold metallo-hydrolase [Pandoraea eparura]VVD99744.1 Ribonuclease Z [Pandoraea eparura]